MSESWPWSREAPRSSRGGAEGAEVRADEVASDVTACRELRAGEGGPQALVGLDGLGGDGNDAVDARVQEDEGAVLQPEGRVDVTEEGQLASFGHQRDGRHDLEGCEFVGLFVLDDAEGGLHVRELGRGVDDGHEVPLVPEAGELQRELLRVHLHEEHRMQGLGCGGGDNLHGVGDGAIDVGEGLLPEQGEVPALVLAEEDLAERVHGVGEGLDGAAHLGHALQALADVVGEVDEFGLELSDLLPVEQGHEEVADHGEDAPPDHGGEGARLDVVRVDPGVVLDGVGVVGSEGGREVLVERLGHVVAEGREGIVQLDELILPEEEVDRVPGQLEVVVPPEGLRHGVVRVVDAELVAVGLVEEVHALPDGVGGDADDDVVVAMLGCRVADVAVVDDGVGGLLDREPLRGEPHVLGRPAASAAARERQAGSGPVGADEGLS